MPNSSKVKFLSEFWLDILSPKNKDPSLANNLPIVGGGKKRWIHPFPKHEVKHKQPSHGWELSSPSPFPIMIAITPSMPLQNPKWIQSICISFYSILQTIYEIEF